MTSLRVTFVPPVPYFLGFGGMEIQIESTLSSLSSLGVDVRRIDLWQHDEPSGILHVFGSAFQHGEIVPRIRARNIPLVVASMIMQRDTWIPQYVFPRISRLLKSTTYGIRRTILESSTRIIALCDHEANQIQTIFRIPSSKIVVIPNGVHERYFDTTVQPDPMFAGKVLCVGTIDENKNQLRIAEACRRIGKEVVFIGYPSSRLTDVAYVEAFREYTRAHDHVTWIGGVDSQSTLLNTAYHSADVLVLASHIEMQGMVALEATAAGCPVVLSNLKTLRSYYGDHATYCDPQKVESIAEAIQTAIGSRRPSAQAVPSHILRWEDVARKLIDVYSSL
ncbi:MAG TPA: hypothetical protein DIS79_02005 [Bacteroidetes bacterium]|nr:hypothetical protein [Bacteroidota bacterium]HRK03482.1 glycosyltransferase [Chlorobiota bacterium]